MPRMLEMTAPNSERDLISAAQREAAGLPANPPPDATPSVRIPGYDIVRTLGRGGQGVVYEAVQAATQRRVALKVISADDAGASRWGRFQREVHLLARMKHPNIVTVYDQGQANGCFFAAMELVEGWPLDVYAHDAGLDRRTMLSLFADVCEAVHAAHQRGVIHRDLKPANILVDGGGRPRVLDFGLAKPLRSDDSDSPTVTAMTTDGQFVGTIRWASPEQVSRRADDVDVRTDVYSLGVILYELLTTAPPYDTSGPLHGAIENIVSAPPPRPSALDRTIDAEVDAIVLRCLAKATERRYGTVGELAADLRRYLAGEAIEAKRDSRLYVLRKTLARHRVLAGAATLALIAGVGFGAVMTVLYQEAKSAQRSAEQEAEDLREELRVIRDNLVQPSNWTSAFNTARALEKLPPEEGWQVLQSAWSQMTDDHPKQQLLKAARFAWFEYLPRVLHLGMTDPSLEVQQWAIDYLRAVAFQDFANDFSAYEAWHEKYGDQPLSAVLEANARQLFAELKTLGVNARGKRVQAVRPEQTLRDRPKLVALAKDLGVVELMMECLTADDASREARRAASDMLRVLPLEEPFLRERILPLMESGPREVANIATRLLGEHKAAFAIDPLVAQMKRSLSDRSDKMRLSDCAQALAEIGDPRVIPDLIAIIAADNTYDTIYGVGYFGLGRMTGVQYDESHDGDWWRQWWEKNRRRFPKEVSEREIPTLSKAQTSPKPAGDDRTDHDDEAVRIAADTLHAGGNERMAYLLTGPEDDTAASADGYRLLLVLPGGDGSASFHPFVERIAKEALGGRYLVAQLIAPQWSPEQFNQVVWPNHGLKFDDAQFLTEDFIRAVVADVSKHHKIDKRYVFALGWSSGGPPVYAAAVESDSPLRGVFVAMSVFKPEPLGDLAGVAGRAVYVLHSPEDFIAMRFPEAARDALAKAGAKTTLATYEGGHGWHGDVYGNIRRGITWLEAQTVADGRTLPAEASSSSSTDARPAATTRPALSGPPPNR